MPAISALSKLIVFWDDNRISIDGDVRSRLRWTSSARFEAAGWNGARVDGHDPEADRRGDRARRERPHKPSLIACRTMIGYGAPTRAGTAKGAWRAARRRTRSPARASRARLAARAVRSARTYPARPGARSARAARAQGANWEERLAAPTRRSRRFRARPWPRDPRQPSTALSPAAGEACRRRQPKRRHAQGVARWRSEAHRCRLSRRCIDRRIGGPHRLQLTRPPGHEGRSRAGDFAGRYIHYGVREHGMAAAMNGIALHGGFIPYGGTFLAFSDYAAPRDPARRR